MDGKSFTPSHNEQISGGPQCVQAWKFIFLEVEVEACVECLPVSTTGIA